MAVLLSTYNGERYLPELLDSVLSQRDVAVRLIVRDDGSTDGTREVLRSYASQDRRMILREHANVGVVASFNELMADEAAADCDYVAFCDQDDVWLPDKLAVAVRKLGQADAVDLPAMYCSNLMVVDEGLGPRGEMRRRGIAPTRESVLVQNVGTGCTEVFNQRARELYLRGVGSAMEMHDYWMTLVCMYMGRVVYDDEPHILYRQHGGNVVGANKKSMIGALRHLLRSGEGKRVPMLRDFIAIYNDSLGDRNLLTINMVRSCTYSLPARIQLVLSSNYVGFENKVTYGFKLRAALGRMY